MFICSMTYANETTKVIYIDPGHGGYDGGAVHEGVKESDINLSISLLLKELYEDNGYRVLLTRDKDIHLSSTDKFNKKEDIKKRVELINNSDCILYISIHQNIYSDSKYSGAQTFYNKYNSVSNSIAVNIQKNLISNTNTNRVAKSIDGVYLIDNVDKVGVLVECGFLSNELERNLLIDSNYHKVLVSSIYYGTLNYLLLV